MVGGREEWWMGGECLREEGRDKGAGLAEGSGGVGGVVSQANIGRVGRRLVWSSEGKPCSDYGKTQLRDTVMEALQHPRGYFDFGSKFSFFLK
ncbi:hypothetical protein E2C01_069367 [Portunus trituberculatus]|uniref:Uncharacterized protein n=1 Tax=Portunus trituberculatus TaxID=210409 RepID=A0A5B7I2L5_PORTR|nr:hypothetical protein [Portunus trituberculatus]